MTILPFGGLGEIGMNCMLVGNRGRHVMVDCGIKFPDALEIGAERKLVDLGQLSAFADQIEAVVLTHGHEDHIGALPWVLPILRPEVKLYATPFTAQLMKRRLAEHGRWDPERVILYEAGSSWQAGPFLAEAIRVTHSLPDCCSIALRCQDGTVLHTGDWKIDERPMDGEHFDREAFARLGDEGVSVLLSDSTNVLTPGRTRSESEVAEALVERIAGWPGRVVVTQFSSNLHRLAGLVEAAEATGRRLCFVGRSLWSYLECAARVGRAPIAPDRILRDDYLEEVADDEVLVVCTGSQGERNASLARAASGDHYKLHIDRGDLVIHSARIIPGNEERTYKMFNQLSMLGAEIVYGRRTGVHASGHACAGELEEMLDLVRPQHFVPVHGEYTFLKAHARLAEARGIPSTLVRNGEVFGFGPTSRATDGGGRGEVPGLVGELELQVVYNDGEAMGDAEEMKLRERKKIAWNGVVVLDAQLVRGPEGATLEGLSVETFAIWLDEGRVLDDIERAVGQAVAGCPPRTPVRDLTEVARLAARRVVRRRLDKRPEVVVVLHEGRAS